MRCKPKKALPLLLLAASPFAAHAVLAQGQSATPVTGNCNAAEYRRLDFRIGEFNVTGKEGAQAGVSRVESMLGGCLLIEHWKGAISGHGQAFFYRDRNDSRWHMTFVNDDGDVLVMSGNFEGDALVFHGTGKVADFAGAHRMAWSPLPAGGTQQVWEFSADGGASWKTLHVGYYARATR